MMMMMLFISRVVGIAKSVLCVVVVVVVFAQKKNFRSGQYTS